MFSKRLKELRKSRGLTQKQVAEKLGIYEQSYQCYEYGKRQPSVKILIKLSNLLNVSIDYLLGVSDSPIRN